MVEPGSIAVNCEEKILQSLLCCRTIFNCTVICEEKLQQSLLYCGARFNHCKLWRQDIQSLYNVEPGSVTVNKGDKIQTLYTVI